MPTSTTAANGTWPSPITADPIVVGAVRRGAVALDGDDVAWAERRPAEGGRATPVRRVETIGRVPDGGLGRSARVVGFSLPQPIAPAPIADPAPPAAPSAAACWAPR